MKIEIFLSHYFLFKFLSSFSKIDSLFNFAFVLLLIFCSNSHLTYFECFVFNGDEVDDVGGENSQAKVDKQQGNAYRCTISEYKQKIAN